MEKNDDFLTEHYITVSDIMRIILKKKFVIILIFVICLFSAFVYKKLFTAPKYISSAKFIVIDTKTSGTLTSSEVAIGASLVSDYAQLIIDRSVLEEVGNQLNPKLTYDQLKNCISVRIPEDSRIVEVRVTTNSPTKSKEIADKMCSVAKVRIFNLLGVDKVNQFAPASMPSGDSSISMKYTLTIGLFAAIGISILFILCYILFNDTLNTEKDVERRLDLCVLSSIPYSHARGKSKRKAAK